MRHLLPYSPVSGLVEESFSKFKFIINNYLVERHDNHLNGPEKIS